MRSARENRASQKFLRAKKKPPQVGQEPAEAGLLRASSQRLPIVCAPLWTLQGSEKKCKNDLRECKGLCHSPPISAAVLSPQRATRGRNLNAIGAPSRGWIPPHAEIARRSAAVLTGYALGGGQPRVDHYEDCYEDQCESGPVVPLRRLLQDENAEQNESRDGDHLLNDF